MSNQPTGSGPDHLLPLRGSVSPLTNESPSSHKGSGRDCCLDPGPDPPWATQSQTLRYLVSAEQGSLDPGANRLGVQENIS